MSATINDGGPAFPLESENEHRYSSGMSLRDWFAGQATADDIRAHLGEYDHETYRWQFTNEEAKYRYADAMLAARTKGAAS